MQSQRDIAKLPLNCNHWGTYRVEAVEGRVARLHAFEQDLDPSPIGHSITDVLYSPTRVYAPMIRKSWLESGPGSNTEKRGQEPFVEVSWEHAEELVAAELKRVVARHGNQAIFAGSYGWASAGRFHHAPSQLKRFLNCLGGFTTRVNSYSLAAAEVVMPYVLGPFMQLLDQSTSWTSIVNNTRLFVAFGGIPLRNSQINAGGLGKHSTRDGLLNIKKSGTRFLSFSPIKSDMMDSIDATWVPVRPGTDTALILAMAFVLLNDESYAQDFLRRYTVGFDEFKDYLLGHSDGVEKTPEWASGITDVSADTITSTARLMAKTRTMISVSWSLTRQDHGEQPFWAATALAAMLGQIGLPGGGIGFGYGAVNAIGDEQVVIPARSFSQGQNPIKTSCIPVARICDMLLNPGTEFNYNGHTLTYPDIDLIYWAGGNPFHHHQDLNRLLKAWQKPSTIIVNEWCWNATAKHADIVLPCTTSLERNDIAISRSSELFFMEKAAEPPGLCRSDFEIFAGLARKLGCLQEFAGNKGEAEWLEEMYNQTREKSCQKGLNLPDYQEFRRAKWHSIEKETRPLVFLDEFREDPVRNPLPTPSGKIEIFSRAIARYNCNGCSPHPKWFEPCEWLGIDDKAYPLHLISNQPATKLHSQLDSGSYSRSCKIRGREPVQINTGDASERDLVEGDIVRVYNDRGSCLAGVRITDDIMKGVVQMSTGAWFDPIMTEEFGLICQHGNPNVLTRDKGTSDLAQGPTAHTCLVEVEKFQGELPAIKAFDPPAIISRGYESNHPGHECDTIRHDRRILS